MKVRCSCIFLHHLFHSCPILQKYISLKSCIFQLCEYAKYVKMHQLTCLIFIHESIFSWFSSNNALHDSEKRLHTTYNLVFYFLKCLSLFGDGILQKKLHKCPKTCVMSTSMKNFRLLLCMWQTDERLSRGIYASCVSSL